MSRVNKLNIKQNNLFCYQCGKDHADTNFKNAGPVTDKRAYKIRMIKCSICNTKRTLIKDKEIGMEKIKFRGWWRHRDGSAADLIEDINDRPVSDLNEDHFIISQFTGHFATGQELYDGDIITHPEADFPVRVYQGDFGEWLTEGKDDSYGGTLEKWSPDECTIIGDIHTTPELLK